MRVSQLHVYPVKSCGGIALSEATLDEGGLRGDRRYMLIDREGNFLTARTEPRLLSIQVRFVEPGNLDRGYVLTPPHGSPLLLPNTVWGDEVPRLTGRVWRDEVQGLEWEAGSSWFSHYLEKRVRLVYQPTDALRQVDPRRARPGDRVSLADGYPLLLTAEGSLADLNQRLDAPLPMSRFRPNLVVADSSAFSEDCWAELRVGSIHFSALKLCDRCVMTTVDPTTARKAKEPLKTLAKFRRWNGAVWFGANLVPRGAGTLRVGDPVEILQTRPHPRVAFES